MMKRIGQILDKQTNLFVEEINSNIVYCRNSEALEKGLTKYKYEIIHCEFCGKELEIIGFYMPTATLGNRWINMNQYEKCNCEKSQKYWEVVKEEKRRQDEQERQNEKEQKYQEQLNLLIKKSNLGERFKSRTLQNFKINQSNKDVYEVCLRYINNFNNIKKQGVGIIFIGPCGVGKTHLAAAIAHQIMKQGLQPIFGTLISLLGRIRSIYDNPSSKENEEQILNSYKKCSLLIIDDLGKEKISEWALEKLYDILNTRYETNMPIIITTNYGIEKLTVRLTINNNYETAEAIVSRIFQMCQGLIIKDNDFRKLEGKDI